MSPAIKYGLGRVALFLVCAIPLVLLLPNVDLLLKLIIAVLASAVLSYFLLRKLRDELTQGVGLDNRSDGDDVSFDPELLVREIEEGVDLGAGEARLLERRPADDQAGCGVRDSKGHEPNIGFEECVRVSSSSST